MPESYLIHYFHAEAETGAALTADPAYSVWFYVPKQPALVPGTARGAVPADAEYAVIATAASSVPKAERGATVHRKDPLPRPPPPPPSVLGTARQAYFADPAVTDFIKAEDRSFEASSDALE